MSQDSLIEELRAVALPEFEVSDRLDGGAQGLVFKAQYNGEVVALKLFNPADDRRRVLREIEFLKENHHECLIQLLTHKSVTIRKRECMVAVYEYMLGGDMERIIRVESEPSACRIAQAGERLASAVEFLWANHIVHRDIKPGNVFIKGEGDFILGDIGFARHLDFSTLTPIGQVVGTDGYKSPEQQAGRRRLTIHSDMFSLGIVLYEYAAHVHPFSCDQTRIGHEPSQPIGELRPDLPPLLCEIIDQMLEDVASKRPASVSDQLRRIREQACSS